MNPLTLLALVALVAPTKTPADGCTLSGTLTVTDAQGQLFVPERAEVYVATRLPMTPRQQQRELVQKGRAFVPRVLVVEKEDVVVFTNLDPFPHEIHSERIKNSFLSGTNQKPETFRHTFSDVGEAKLGCLIHAGMSGTILTVPNALHAQVAADGTWKLTGLPAQPLDIVFWQHTGMDSAQQVRTVTPCSQTAPVDVVIRGAARSKSPPYGGRPSTD